MGPGYEEKLKILQLPPLKIKRERGDLIMACQSLNRLIVSDKNTFFKAELERVGGHEWNLEKETMRRGIRKLLLVTE